MTDDPADGDGAEGGEGRRNQQPRVLVVDDEREVADAYALRLDEVARVATATGGPEALAWVEESGPPDVVLLDRHMPGHSGDDVLAELGRREVRTRVVMVTAVDPDLTVLDLPFDDYLCKPVDRSDLRASVDQQRRVLAYELLGTYFELESKRAVVDAELPDERLADHDRFQTLERRRSRLRGRLDRLLDDPERVIDTFAGVDREGDGDADRP